MVPLGAVGAALTRLLSNRCEDNLMENQMRIGPNMRMDRVISPLPFAQSLQGRNLPNHWKKPNLHVVPSPCSPCSRLPRFMVLSVMPSGRRVSIPTL